MNTGLINSTPVLAAESGPRHDIAPVRTTAPAVQTELPASQAVAATGASQGAEGDMQRHPPVALAPEASVAVQKLSIDPATHVAVFSKVDRETGQVLSQFPDQAVLRRKAYFRQMLDRQSAEYRIHSDKRA